MRRAEADTAARHMLPVESRMWCGSGSHRPCRQAGLVASQPVPIVPDAQYGRAPRDTRRRTLSLVGSAVGLLGAAFVIRIIAQEWDEVQRGIQDAVLGLVVCSILVGMIGMGWIGLQWSAVVRTLGGGPTDVKYVMRSYFIGQLGKYVPGGVWPVLGRAEMLTRAGTPRRFSYSSVGLSMATAYLAAAIVAAAAAPFAVSQSNSEGAWALLALPLGIACLHPAVLHRVIALGERIFSKGHEAIVVPPWRTSVVLVLRHVPAWLLIAGATWLVARSLHIEVDFALLVFATPLAWAAGLAAIPVPGGIGVREAVFVALTAGVLDASTAATIAVAARLVFIIGDLLAAAVSAVAIPSPPGSPAN